MKYIKMITTLLLLAGAVSLISGSGKAESHDFESNEMGEFFIGETETAVFAGGCFWGVEGVFERLEGVEDVVSGYSGGSAETARYNLVGSGKTRHAEAVRIVYDPSQISYEKLLEIFFLVAHNPTELNYQGPDVGTEYRSAVFYIDETQKMKTEKYIKELEMKKRYSKPIVTQLEKLDAFYPAEAYHQNFMKLNPNHPYIVYWDIPKVRDLEERYPELLSQMK
ncbi:MAG: peptide-methionine (S)-S-oxide reductase MsrA [Spirochaetaceae bacterium]|nr:peptide-methionine (S)-S-oxide reductase MsrA [Spirochaetaceae bacterium]